MLPAIAGFKFKEDKNFNHPPSALCLPHEIHGDDSEAYFTGVIRHPSSEEQQGS